MRGPGTKLGCFLIVSHRFARANIAAKNDTSMKIGRDGQFDMLKKVGCQPKSKNVPNDIFRSGY